MKQSTPVLCSVLQGTTSVTSERATDEDVDSNMLVIASKKE